MYFIDEGVFEWCKNTDKGKSTIKYYHAGESFGDIFLLHHVKTFGNIISHHEGLLYRLERETYKHFKKMSVVKKRTLYLMTLKKQNLFRSFSEEELEKICDVLT